MLMVGCSGGEGYLAHDGPNSEEWVTKSLHEAMAVLGKRMGVSFVVLKEFPSHYREAMQCFTSNGYIRMPSMPMVKLNIAYPHFEDFMQKGLGKSMRKNLRRKFKKAAEASPIELEITHDVTPYVKEIYPLYLQVYERAKHKFEKLTERFLNKLGQDMPERSRFFIWRQAGKIVAFSVCLVLGDTIFDEYLGLDYSVAYDLNLYFLTLRDILDWAMRSGYKTYVSTSLCYDPKLHLRCSLIPLDLYVWNVSTLANRVFRKIAPFLQPIRYDPVLRRFPNAHEL